jgi:hypothetical protein
MVTAERPGRCAYVAVGRVPIRDLHGACPVPGQQQQEAGDEWRNRHRGDDQHDCGGREGLEISRRECNRNERAHQANRGRPPATAWPSGR